MAKIMDVRLSTLDNDTVIVSVTMAGGGRESAKTYGFAGWPEALEYLRQQTAPPISLAEVRELIERASDEPTS